jgi:hypothetical protein
MFRYFPNCDALLTALNIDSYSSLAEAAETAEAQVHQKTLQDRWTAICHGARNWSLAHRQGWHPEQASHRANGLGAGTGLGTARPSTAKALGCNGHRGRSQAAAQ